MILRPYGIVIDGELGIGLEIVRRNGRIETVRPHTGLPEPWVLSVPFVNAHSHFEYRGLQGRVPVPEPSREPEEPGHTFAAWIGALTRAKAEQDPAQVEADVDRAAAENRATGVWAVGEHSDRPFSAAAMARHRLGGRVFQEVLTFFERNDPAPKVAAVRQKAESQATNGLPVHLSPHSLYTVDEGTLAELAQTDQPISVHLAESRAENLFSTAGTGPIAETHRRNGFDPAPTGERVVARAERLGLLRPGAQLVHVCDIDPDEVARIARSGASVAHCPRSNRTLRCPIAPIRELLDAGVPVGLGLDSPASSGPIDMFAEMRAALELSRERGGPVADREVWSMATTLGARSLMLPEPRIAAGCDGPLIRIAVPDAQCTEDLIERGSPGLVSWID
ncbi:MAG: amidohydrolase family protein [Fimbriimonadaceae bacterium]